MEASDVVIVELAARQHWAFSRRQALGLCVSSSGCGRRLASGHWCASGHRGVYRLPGHTPTWHQRLMAAVLAGPGDAAASHRSAAVLHGLRAGTPVELTVPPGLSDRRRAMVHRSPLDRRDRTTLAGIPATAVERTLVDLAAVVDEKALEQALEAALNLGLTTAERVRRRLDELATPGRAGVAQLRSVLRRGSKGRAAGSPMEVRVIQLLRDAGLEAPVRQFEVVVGDQRYFVDLAYPHRLLAIELDGEEHHGRSQFQRDRTRQNALVLAGWTVLRFTWADVMERPGDIVAAIALARAA